MLEHKPESGAQPTVPRAWASEVLATGDYGRSDLLRAKGRPVAVASSKEVRHTVSNVRPVCQPGTQHAGPQC